MRRLFLPSVVCVTLLAGACSGEVAAPGSRQAAQSWGPETPNFNLEVILRGSGFGHVKFRQPNDQEFTIYLDTWVRDLEPNTTYVIERAVDQVLDGICTSTGWLDLGTVVTDDTGTGRAALSRGLPASLNGQYFDIHFHLIKQSDSSEVLTSSCYRYAVSM